MSDEADPTDSSKLSQVRVTAAKCVRCGQPVQPRFRPFCGQRCADIDLGKWFTGGYKVATDEGPDQHSGPGGEEDPEKP